MNNKEYESIIEKHGETVYQNKQLKKANTKLKSENKHLRRVIKNLKDKLNDKPGNKKYKNGKRGSMFNG